MNYRGEGGGIPFFVFVQNTFIAKRRVRDAGMPSVEADAMFGGRTCCYTCSAQSLAHIYNSRSVLYVIFSFPKMSPATM